MVRPTPVEARILRLLSAHEELIVTLHGKFEAVEGSNLTEMGIRWRLAPELRANRDHVKSLARKGYIERVSKKHFAITQKGSSSVKNIDIPKFSPKDSDMTADFIKERLGVYHNRQYGWIVYPEIQIEDRFMDVYTLSLWNVKRIVAYEIKVNRSDLLLELSQPEKREVGLRWSNNFYFILPQGMAKDSEIPPEAGFKEVLSNGYVTTVRDAPWSEVPDPDWNLTRHLINRYYMDQGGLDIPEES